VYRFAFRGRYLVGQFIVLFLAVLFIRLGFWQLSRLHQQNAAAWRRVTASGTFDARHQMLVRFREFQDNPGDYVATPLLMANGDAVLVVRGWQAGGEVPGTTQVPVVTPSGSVTVTGIYLASESSKGAAPLIRNGVVVESSRVSTDLVQPTVPYRLEPGYVQLQVQSPAVTKAEPSVLGPPDFSNGPPNLSYAVQWFIFTAVGVIGWPLLLRKRARERQRQQALGPEQLEAERAASAAPTGPG
jgi:cytochrome oxidase assembly protein ShyY1